MSASDSVKVQIKDAVAGTGFLSLVMTKGVHFGRLLRLWSRPRTGRRDLMIVTASDGILYSIMAFVHLTADIVNVSQYIGGCICWHIVTDELLYIRRR